MIYHSPENLDFQHFPVKEKFFTHTKIIDWKRLAAENGTKIDTLTCVDIVEIVKCGGNILEVFEFFLCHNLEKNRYTEFVSDMFEKRDLFNTQGKALVQNLAKNIGLPVYGDNTRKDINEE